LGPSLAALIYIRLVWHKHTDPSAAGDDQLGVKTVCATLILTGVFMAAIGLQQLLGEILTWGQVKLAFQTALPRILVGSAVLGFITQVYLPRTNHQAYPKAMRLTAGVIAVVGSSALVVGLAQTLNGLFVLEWDPIAEGLVASIVAGILAGGGLVTLSNYSGIDTDDFTEGVAQAASAAQNMASNVQQNIAQAMDDGMDQPAAPEPQPAAAPQQPMAQPQQPMAQPGGFQPAPQQPMAQPGGFQPAPQQAPAPGQFQPAPQRPPGPPPPGGYKR
jgi:hypothetical protein